jgi:hypothetical protein
MGALSDVQGILIIYAVYASFIVIPVILIIIPVGLVYLLHAGVSAAWRRTRRTRWWRARQLAQAKRRVSAAAALARARMDAATRGRHRDGDPIGLHRLR